MHFPNEGNAHLLRGLAQGSLAGMGMGYVEIVDVSGGVMVFGHRPRRSGSVGSLVNKCIRAVRVEEIDSPY